MSTTTGAGNATSISMVTNESGPVHRGTKARLSEKPGAKCLVFACSGAADVGEVADRAARQMSREGVAAMSCVASIGTRDSDMMFNTDLADQVLLVDGCPRACTRGTFEQAGLRHFKHFDLSEFGLKKGGTPSTPCNIHAVVNHAREILTG